MADQNRSGNRRGMNSIDDIDESHSLSELERIGARVGRRSIQRSQLEDRMRSEGKLLNSLLDEGRRTPIIREGPFYNEQVGSLRTSISGLRGRMNTLDAAGVARAESEASTFISRQFNSSSINGQVMGMQRQEAIQNRAFGMSTTPYDQLQSGRENILSQIRGTERQALNEVKGLFNSSGQVNPGGSASLGVIFGGLQGKTQEMAAISAAQQLQKMQGQDPSSRLSRIIGAGQDANSTLSAVGIAQEMRNGGVNISNGGSMQAVSSRNVNDEIVNQSRRLVEALDKLAQGAGKTDEELAKFRATAEESASNLDKLKQAQSGGGGGFNPYNAAMAASSGFNSIGAGIQGIMVNQRMGQVGNVAGFANIENQKYDQYRAARGGDTLSMMSLGAWSNSQAFGKNLNSWQNYAQGAYAAGGAAQGVAGGLQFAEGLKSYINPVAQVAGTSGTAAQNMLGGATTTLQGVSTAAQSGMDIIRNVSGGAANIQGTNMSQAAARELLKNSSVQLQNFRDFAVGMGTVSQGMGAAGTGFMTANMSNSGLDNMIGSRISPEQFTNMAAQGVAGMGSMFSSNSVYAARGLERSGYGSMQENMQRMSTLAAAGSNNPQAGLGSVLEAAFTKGLESSKSISAMVQNTAAMVQGSVGRAAGMDTTAAAAQLLSSGINMNDPNKEFAVARAATAQEIANNIGTNTGVNFAGMVATARISRTTGLSGTESILAQKLDTATLRTLQKQAQTDPGGAAAAYANQGINVDPSGALNLTKKLLDARMSTLLEGGGAGFAVGGNTDDIKRKIIAGQPLDRQETLQVGQAARFGGFSGAKELVDITGGVHKDNAPNASLKAGVAIAGEAGSDELKNNDFLRTSGFKQLAESTKSANEQMAKFGGAMGILVKMTAGLEKEGANGIEAKFATAAADSAESFGKHTVTFERAVNSFNSKIDQIISRAGLGMSDDGGAAAATGIFTKGQKAMNNKKGPN